LFGRRRVGLFVEAPSDEERSVLAVGTSDKMENAKERVEGRARETFGAATDDEEQRDRGRGQQTEADVKDAGEKVKDAAGKVGDAFHR
jgi:uncharacterized protein YjbJ (UPF0337 family)